jgi:hypothetical protein
MHPTEGAPESTGSVFVISLKMDYDNLNVKQFRSKGCLQQITSFNRNTIVQFENFSQFGSNGYVKALFFCREGKRRWLYKIALFRGGTRSGSFRRPDGIRSCGRLHLRLLLLNCRPVRRTSRRG